jgi:hypothetical protein
MLLLIKIAMRITDDRCELFFLNSAALSVSKEGKKSIFFSLKILLCVWHSNRSDLLLGVQLQIFVVFLRNKTECVH